MSKLAAIHLSRYGVTVEEAGPISVVWAAEHLMELEGVDVAKKQLRAVNRRREKLGKRPAYVDYGHPLF